MAEADHEDLPFQHSFWSRDVGNSSLKVVNSLRPTVPGDT